MKDKAIALSRVSTKRQMLEGNLEPQEERIIKAAEYLGVEVVQWWRMAVSSRKGKNTKRKDLIEMLDYCKRNKQVKYLIVDEVDRFMRSIDEYYYWKMNFKIAGTQLRLANRPDVNPDDQNAVFDELIDVYKAEQSNQERITKTPEKMISKISAGYYPGNPRSGYKKSEIPSLHVRDEPRWSYIRDTLKELAAGEYGLSEGLKRLHERGYLTRDFGPRAVGGKKIDMHRFKNMVAEPYYAGIVKMSNWPINENGLHEAMITKEEHERLVQLVKGKGNKFIVNKHNPDFPLSNSLYCAECLDLQPEDIAEKQARMVGYPHHNGKAGDKRKFYKRYRCRLCNKGFLVTTVHAGFSDFLDSYEQDPELRDKFTNSLRKAWSKRRADKLRQIEQFNGQLNLLQNKKHELTMAISSVTASGDMELAEDFKESLNSIKAQISELQGRIKETSEIEEDFLAFTNFSLLFIENLRGSWWGLSQDNRLRCKQLLFPAKTAIESSGKVYTQENNAVIRLIVKKKAPEEANFTNMEGPVGLEPTTRGLKGHCSNLLSYGPA